jgi:Fic family protein
LTDVLDDEAGLAVANADDVQEVTNYLKALRFVRDQLRDPAGLPVSTRLLTQAHRILMTGVRGSAQQPGEIRSTQNWIGGTRPGNAVFVPPPAAEVQRLLGEWEGFIHQDSPSLPPLVRIALVHAQFETIHPFLDGNGRIGRLLVAVLLEDWNLLPEPLLYVSGYLKTHQAEYVRRLSAVRSDGDWENWVAFFLEAVEMAADEAQHSILAIAALISADRKRVLDMVGSTLQALRLFEQLPTMPKLSIERAQAALEVSYPTARAAVMALVGVGVLKETSGRARSQTFAYQAYMDLLR